MHPDDVAGTGWQHTREGFSNAQVANRLGITPDTVRNHVQRILLKRNVHSKLEAVVVTSREGLQQGQG